MTVYRRFEKLISRQLLQRTPPPYARPRQGQGLFSEPCKIAGFPLVVVMPSPLVKFSQSAFLQSRAVIGGESLSISGGATLSVVLNAVTDSRDFEAGGYEQDIEFEAVARADEFLTAYPLNPREYLGKLASARGRTFRVVRIASGQGFTRIELGSKEMGS